MAQYSRPEATVSSPGWTAVGATTHHEAVDETAAVDTDYAETTGSEIIRFDLSAVMNPNTTAGHILRYRTMGEVTCRIMQGTTIIAQYEHNDPTLTTHEQTLTAIQAAAMTDYANLFFEVEPNPGVDDLPLLLSILNPNGSPLYGNLI